jgi:hypothetical protein
MSKGPERSKGGGLGGLLGALKRAGQTYSIVCGGPFKLSYYESHAAHPDRLRASKPQGKRIAPVKSQLSGSIHEPFVA